MKRTTTIAVIAILALLLSGSVLAQQTKPEGQSTDLPPRGGAIAIPDNAYNGTLATMACTVFTVAAAGSVNDVEVEVALEHTWVGDLVFKVVSPSATVATVMSRPGFAEPADDGTGGFGDSSNLALSAPVSFSAAGVTDAELMGVGPLGTSGVVCQDDGFCSYFPNPGAAVDSGDLSTIFDGEPAAGDWQFCAGDAGGGDAGNLGLATFVVSVDAVLPDSVPVPTMSRYGLIALVMMMALIAGTLLVRRSS